MYLKFYILVLFFLLQHHRGVSNDTVYVHNKHQLVNASSSILLFEDKSKQLPFREIIGANFYSIDKEVPNLGFSKSAFWVKVTVCNKTSENILLMNLSLPTLDFVEFYYPNSVGTYTYVSMGEHLLFSQRKYDDPDYIFDLNIPHDSVATYYLKIISKEGIQLPITIGSQKNILGQLKNKGLLSGIYFGIMLVIILYNLFIYFSVKDKNYLYYVVYVLFTWITQTSLQGYSFQFLWPNIPQMADYVLFISPSMTGITGVIFMNVFLEVKSYSKLLHRLTYILCFPYFISVFFLLIGDFLLSQVVLELNSMIIALFMLITPIVILKKGFKPAKFFLIAWTVFLLGICVFILKDLEILPFNNFTRYTMQIGTALETVLLSFALADRINILKKEKEYSQATALLALEQNEKLITEQNIILESKVKERTVELRNTLENLKDTQAQLVNAEKMASLGQLTAGIAHEINNPINFVSANVKPLKLDIDDVLQLIKKYEDIKPNDFSDRKFNEILEYRKEIDIDYLKQEMTDLLNGIEDGARRTADIVSGLKNFSRLDENDIKEVNINDGIQSTLVLLTSAIPKNVKIITNYGEIPVIECFPGKLNQVFMNLLSNALHAIEMKDDQTSNQLVISSYSSNSKVFVTIEDTGIGMTKEVKDKMFDPFFTTKDVGKGTGLGMSIVFKIIESHGAKIEVESEYGFGTKIILILNKKINLTHLHHE